MFLIRKKKQWNFWLVKQEENQLLNQSEEFIGGVVVHNGQQKKSESDRKRKRHLLWEKPKSPSAFNLIAFAHMPVLHLQSDGPVDVQYALQYGAKPDAQHVAFKPWTKERVNLDHGLAFSLFQADPCTGQR